MEPAALRNSVPPGRAVPFFGFVCAVVVLATVLVFRPLVALPDRVPALPAAFWVMAVLAAALDARPFTPLAQRNASAVFPSICFTFAILLEWGLGPAVAAQALSVVVSGWRQGYAPWRVGFNIAQYACALAAAYAVLRFAPGGPFDVRGRPGLSEIAALIGAAVAWFAVNYGSVGTAIALRFGEPWWPSFRRGLPYELLSTGSLLLLSPVLVAAAEASVALIPLILAPLFAVHRMSRLSAEQGELASLDPLTGLMNRKALLAEVADQIRVHAERAAKSAPDAHLALLLIDLDRFKHVNDALGHAVGDRLLVAVSTRLSSVVRPGDVVARLGGDEFAIVATGLPDVDEARRLGEQVAAGLTEPVSLDGLPLDVGGSIGVALYPEHGEDFETLMRHADVAMYDAKHRGDAVAVYAPESDHNSPERLNLLADLRRVLEAAEVAAAPDRPGEARAAAPDRPGEAPGGRRNGTVPGGGGPRPGRAGRRSRRTDESHPDELITRIIVGADPTARGAAHRRVATVADPVVPPAERGRVDQAAPAVPPPPAPEARAADADGDPGVITMYYQPQVAVATGEVVGVEALLRWWHPVRGMVDPGELIRVAEQSAVMRLLTRRVVDDVVRQLAAWSAAGIDLRASLNVSVRDLHTSEIGEQVAELLHRHGVPPDRLQVEITEGALMADPRRVLATITRLHQLGVAISLDDFGTGYSSLQHLRRLPLAEVKVDRSFVLGMAHDPDDAAIVRSMIELAGALGLRVVAEGVEDERTWRMLHEAGCAVAQGWFYARPMPADELVAWLARYRPLRPVAATDLGNGRRPAG